MPVSNNLSLGQRLRRERERLKWSQERLAEAVGTTARSINRWEQDKVIPHPHYRVLLCNVFNVSDDALFGSSAEVLAQPLIWNVSARRNPLFTGREEVLEALAKALHTTEPENAVGLTRMQAISGLGGIGKTQIAIEYAYRYRNDYQAVLWVRAETREIFLADLVALAEPLNLPEKSAHEQQRVLEAVKRWLCSYDRWLLILDNVEDLFLIQDVLPLEPLGHILLTTRAQASGALVRRIELERMSLEEGTFFLLRRAKLIKQERHLSEVPEEWCNLAKAITQCVDGLPLALDQAGAYIEETGCSLPGYLERYNSRRAALLDRRGRVGAENDHPQSVRATLSLSLEQVERGAPAAVNLLRLCAFLHPDAIPEKLLTGVSANLDPLISPLMTDPLALDAALAAARMYSLVRRHPETQMLSMHRLVQAVLQDTLSEQEQCHWAAQAIEIVSARFPMIERATDWTECQHFLPQALHCLDLIEHWKLSSPAVGRLMHETGCFMHEYADYARAEALLSKARDIRRQTLGTQHPDVARSLNALAVTYRVQGKTTQAEPLYLEAIALFEQAPGPQHLQMAQSMNDLALCYSDQAKYAQAESLLQRALVICKQEQGGEPVEMATVLNNLGLLYIDQGKYEQAEPLHQRALLIWERILGADHPSVAVSLNNLAYLYNIQGKYRQAEPLHQRALAVREKVLGPEHPDVANSLNNLGWLYTVLGQYEQAEPLHRRALAIREKVFGPEHPFVALSLSNLGKLTYAQRRYAEAKTFHERALALRERLFGPDHPEVAGGLLDLAWLSLAEGDADQAGLLAKRSREIYERAFGPCHRLVGLCLNTQAQTAAHQGKDAEAGQLFEQAYALLEQTLGPAHPHVAQCLYDQALFSAQRGSSSQSRSLYRRAVAIWEQALGLHHPQVTSSMQQYEELLQRQQEREAE